MASGKCLAEPGAIRITVEIDDGNVERIEQGGEIVGGKAAVVKVSRVAQLLPAGVNSRRPGVRFSLQQRTVEGLGFAGAAIVQKQHVAAVTQRRKKRKIPTGRTGGRVAWTAFGSDDRFEGRLRTISVRVELETDLDVSCDLSGGVESTFDGAAISVADLARVEGQGADAHRVGEHRVEERSG
jgi:hypothetical protein